MRARLAIGSVSTLLLVAVVARADVPRVCVVSSPYTAHIRTAGYTLAGMASMAGAVSDAMQSSTVDVASRTVTVFDTLGISADHPGDLEAVFKHEIPKTSQTDLASTYVETWLSWDAGDILSKRTVLIRPATQPLVTYVSQGANQVHATIADATPYVPVTVTVTIEKAKRRFLTADFIKQNCGGIIGSPPCEFTKETQHTYEFRYTYELDWKTHAEVIKARSACHERQDSKLGFGYEVAIGKAASMLHDSVGISVDGGISLFLSLKEDKASEPVLVDVLHNGRSESRAGSSSVRSALPKQGGGANDLSLSTGECLITYRGNSVLHRVNAKLTESSVGYQAVLEISHPPLKPDDFAAPRCAGDQGDIGPAAILGTIPDINDIYARYIAQLRGVPTVFKAVRPTLYGDAGHAASPTPPPPNPDDCKRWSLPGQRLVCKATGMAKTTELARTYGASAVTSEETADDAVLARMFADRGPDLAFYTKTFDALPPTQWRFVIALEAAREQLVAKLGKGGWGKNTVEANSSYCAGTMCFEREEAIADLVKANPLRSAWQRSILKARVNTAFEHTAGCYVFPGDRPVEMVIDSWRDQVRDPEVWWKANDAAGLADMKRACKSERLCSDCYNLYAAYRQVKVFKRSMHDVREAWETLCPDAKGRFDAADATYGAAIQKALGLSR